MGGTVQFPPAALEEFVRRDETQQGEKGSEWRANSGNVSGRNRQMDRRVDGQMAAVPSNVPSRGRPINPCPPGTNISSALKTEPRSDPLHVRLCAHVPFLRRPRGMKRSQKHLLSKADCFTEGLIMNRSPPHLSNPLETPPTVYGIVFLSRKQALRRNGDSVLLGFVVNVKLN